MTQDSKHTAKIVLITIGSILGICLLVGFVIWAWPVIGGIIAVLVALYFCAIGIEKLKEFFDETISFFYLVLYLVSACIFAGSVVSIIFLAYQIKALPFIDPSTKAISGEWVIMIISILALLGSMILGAIAVIAGASVRSMRNLEAIKDNAATITSSLPKLVASLEAIQRNEHK